ncbi:DeoR/GlpR family DNA-binding transcription regulator [Leifsonia sp. 1010]|uniref:DeoR/GlpR family DNA-binding transcription regulator n=1 Tax=Leifsonia sp. 1010 TaxID=2817769 RepID=UPI0028598C14|nr:DeoR/GlpR family DNA-binding transcription regulator [Leifsonia sp. 1010]MDR6611393.1 DeoR/GlpR family transcriptional regulator of sugar metabolism [Leifsonia sp. 1010]
MRYTDAPARREELLRRLSAEGYVSSSRVAEELGVSEMTIRRDLRQLEGEGLARRVIGGASLPNLGHGRPFDERAVTGSGEKRAIAEACLDLLDGAITVALDAGTTVAPLTGMLRPGTTIVSHSAPVIQAAIERDDVELVAVGGVYQSETRSFAGATARRTIADYSVDIAVLSATAVDTTGILCANALDAELKQELARAARTTILLVDHSKLGARAPIRVGGLDLVDVILTDPGADPDDLQALRDAGATVVVAGEHVAPGALTAGTAMTAGTAPADAPGVGVS